MKEHIVILGGGFGGWYAARALAPRLRSGATITLVDRVDHMLYTPMLTEVAGGNLPSRSIAVPMKDLPDRVQFVKAQIKEVNLADRSVTLPSGEVLRATQLVFALGSTTAYHGIKGAQEQSLPLKTLEDANDILDRIDELVTQAAACEDAARRRQLLTVVVAGGGYTGVETIAAVGEHLNRQAKEKGLNTEEVKMVIVEPSGRLMHETPETLALYSQRFLEGTGVRVLLKTGVSEVHDDTVTFSNGEQLKVGLLIWDTGIEPNSLVQDVGLPLGKHHGIDVDACFRVKGLKGVWAIGDCAEIPQPDGTTYAPTAQNATREGVHLAQNISAVLRGESPRPFRFRMLGQLAILSDKKAVAEILGVKISGLVAWGLWWVIYTAKLPSVRGRVEVLKKLVP